MTPQIQGAFDKKYEEIGEDVWHGIGNDRIFYFGWKACESNCAKLLSEQDYQYNKQINELIVRHVAQIKMLEQQNSVLIEQLVKVDLITPRTYVIELPEESALFVGGE